VENHEDIKAIRREKDFKIKKKGWGKKNSTRCRLRTKRERGDINPPAYGVY